VPGPPPSGPVSQEGAREAGQSPVGPCGDPSEEAVRAAMACRLSAREFKMGPAPRTCRLIPRVGGRRGDGSTEKS
jgi:hypothetical protein